MLGLSARVERLFKLLVKFLHGKNILRESETAAQLICDPGDLRSFQISLLEYVDIRQDLAGWSISQNSASSHHHRSSGVLRYNIHVERDNQDRASFLVPLAEQIHDASRPLKIEPRRGLVHHQNGSAHGNYCGHR